MDALPVFSLCALAALLSYAEAPKTTRYGAQIYRKHRVDTPPPTLKLPDNWRLIEDDGERLSVTRKKANQ